jgi:hypothetical protein
VERGLSFLGFRVFPAGLRLDARSKDWLRRKYRHYQHGFRRGEWTETELQQRLGALFAFAQQADSRALRVKLIERCRLFGQQGYRISGAIPEPGCRQVPRAVSADGLYGESNSRSYGNKQLG